MHAAWQDAAQNTPRAAVTLFNFMSDDDGFYCVENLRSSSRSSDCPSRDCLGSAEIRPLVSERNTTVCLCLQHSQGQGYGPPPPPLRQLFSKNRFRCRRLPCSEQHTGTRLAVQRLLRKCIFRSALFFIVNRLRFDYTGCCAEIMFFVDSSSSR